MGHEEVNLMLTKRYIKYTNPWEKAKRTRRCYKIAQGILFLKGTVTVMSSDLLFKEEHSLITTSFFSPFSEQWCLRYRRIFNYDNFLWCFFSRTVKQHLKMAIFNEKRYWVQIIFFRIFFQYKLYLCLITTQATLDWFASNFDWGTRGFWVGPILTGKIVKIVIYNKGRVNGETSFPSLGQAGFPS